jgi:hypothetical protein
MDPAERVALSIGSILLPVPFIASRGAFFESPPRTRGVAFESHRAPTLAARGQTGSACRTFFPER